MQIKPSKIRKARYQIERLLDREKALLAPKREVQRNLIEEEPKQEAGWIKRLFGWMMGNKN